MKKKEFLESMNGIRLECVDVSRVGRVAAASIKDEVAAFIDETLQKAIDCEAYEKDSFLMNRFLFFISDVVDIFDEKYVSTEEGRNVYNEFMEDVTVLRDEVIDAYAYNDESPCMGKDMGFMIVKVSSLAEVIRGAARYFYSTAGTLFHDRVIVGKSFHRILSEWNPRYAQGFLMPNFLLQFSDFIKNRSLFGGHESEEELFEIFNDMLDGKKKFSNPVTVYQKVGSVRTVLNEDADPDVKYSLLEDEENGYARSIEVTSGDVIYC